MRIGLDVDGVLAQWEPNARRLLKEEFGVDIPESTEWSSIWKSVAKEQWDWLWTDALVPLFLECEPYPGVYDGVSGLREIGDIVIITSVPRPAIQDRLDWLIHQCLWFDEFRVVNSMSDKSKVVPLCDVYLDDSPQVADDILEHTSAKMILWNRPWNMGVNDPKSRRQYWRVDSWEEVIALCESVKELYT